MGKPNLSVNTDTCHMYFHNFILALLAVDFKRGVNGLL